MKQARLATILRSATLSLLLGLVATGPTKAEHFVLGAEDQAAPWGCSDGTGCGNDIVRAAFTAAGDTVALEVLPYARAKKLTLDGRLAGCFAVCWEPELEGKVVFAAQPIYRINAVLLVRSGSGTVVRSLDDLTSESTLGLVLDYEYPQAVWAAARRGVKVEKVATEKQNLKKLAAGRIDATVLNCDPLKSLDYLLRQAGVEGKVDRVSDTGIEGAFVGFSLLHPAGARARERFDAGMAAILADGTYGAIVQRWADRIKPPALEAGK